MARAGAVLVVALVVVSAAYGLAPPTRTGVVCPGVGAFAGGGGKVKPKTIMLACGDGNFWIASLAWKSWGSAKASATGEVHYNDCTPYCAAGHFHVIPGTASLTKLVSGKCQGSPSRFYTRLQVFPGKKGKNIPPAVDESLPARC